MAPSPTATASPALGRAEPTSGGRHRARLARDGAWLRLSVDGIQQRWLVVRADDRFWVAGGGHTWQLRLLPLIDPRIHADTAADGRVSAPMPGAVIACFVSDGEVVEAGQRILALEAMKMEHTLHAPIEGQVDLLVGVGDRVTGDQVLADVRPIGDGDA